MFPERTEFTNTPDTDFFLPLFETPFENFTKDNIFAPWICARWLLFINRTSHFPIVLAKQTVSNPWALVDNSLVLADAHGKCVQAASNYTAVAACFMQKLLSSKLEKVKIPTIDCFLNQNPMKKENHLMLWEPEWKPNFEASDVTVPINFVRWKTMYELLLANFSSRHIKSSKALASHVRLINILLSTLFIFSVSTRETILCIFTLTCCSFCRL